MPRSPRVAEIRRRAIASVRASGGERQGARRVLPCIVSITERTGPRATSCVGLTAGCPSRRHRRPTCRPLPGRVSVAPARGARPRGRTCRATAGRGGRCRSDDRLRRRCPSYPLRAPGSLGAPGCRPPLPTNSRPCWTRSPPRPRRRGRCGLVGSPRGPMAAELAVRPAGPKFSAEHGPSVARAAVAQKPLAGPGERRVRRASGACQAG